MTYVCSHYLREEALLTYSDEVQFSQSKARGDVIIIASCTCGRGLWGWQMRLSKPDVPV